MLILCLKKLTNYYTIINVPQNNRRKKINVKPLCFSVFLHTYLVYMKKFTYICRRNISIVGFCTLHNRNTTRCSYKKFYFSL